MADESRFPQIPGTVWWGVRNILNRTPNTTIDARALAVQLKVQDAAATQYVKELKSVGILNEEGKATALANKWRLDGTYLEAMEELNSAVYPQSLRDIAPQNQGDREKAVSWFQHAGLGLGSAKNKTGTYFLLGAQTPNEAPTRTSTIKTVTDPSMPLRRPETKLSGKMRSPAANDTKQKPMQQDSTGIPLNINVQIHIAADAGSDQIESIFSAMRRYLYDRQDS